jgi:hypothetical protein
MNEAVAEMATKPWVELEATEHLERLYFPERIYRRKKNGTLEGTDVMLSPLREYERRRARKTARDWAAKEGLDAERDSDLFDNMDTICQLAIAVRSTTPPYEPFEIDHMRFDRTYDRGSITRLWETLVALTNRVEPVESEIPEEMVVALASAIASQRAITPFAAFDSRSQANFIIGLASRLMSYESSKSRSASSEPSTAESST